MWKYSTYVKIVLK